MMTFPNEWKILEWDEKPQQTNQKYNELNIIFPFKHEPIWLSYFIELDCAIVSRYEFSCEHVVKEVLHYERIETKKQH